MRLKQTVLRIALLACVLLLFGSDVARGQNCDVEGSWEVSSVRFTDPDGTVRDVTVGRPPGLKILSPTHWAFVELRADSTVSAGGGRYEVDGDRYTEWVDYHGGKSYIGKRIDFECRVEEDRWYQDGMLPDGTKLEEVYRRAR